MQCQHAQSKLAAYVDGDLAPGPRQMLEGHLAECPACAEELRAVRKLLADCQEFLVCPGPAYSFDTLQRRMARVRPLDEVVEFLPRLRVNPVIPRMMVAALFLLLVAGSLLPLRLARLTVQSIQSPFELRKAQCAPEYQEVLDREYREAMLRHEDRSDTRKA